MLSKCKRTDAYGVGEATASFADCTALLAASCTLSIALSVASLVGLAASEVASYGFSAMLSTAAAARDAASFPVSFAWAIFRPGFHFVALKAGLAVLAHQPSRAISRKYLSSFPVIAPGLPLPTARSFTATMGIISRVVLVRNASSASKRSLS